MSTKFDENSVAMSGDGGHAGPAPFTASGLTLAAPEVGSSRWFAGTAWGVILASLYPLLAATPLAIFAATNRVADHLRGAEVGVDCAVVGFTILALQFVITARLSWVEAPFGLDVLLVFHRAMALVATALLCTHPILVAREEGWSLLVGMHVRAYVWAGRLALALLLLQVIVSLARRVIRLRYDQWRRLHNPIALAILALGFSHGLAAGADMHGGGLVVWGALPAGALAFWLYAHVARPKLLLRRPFRVIETRAEAPHVWTLTLEPHGKRPFRFAPGQFQFLRLYGAGVAPEEHPFTIASSPARSSRISLTIRELGDYTAGIGRIRAGDHATVHGPFGRFSHSLHPDERDLVFVAGGIGITPFMSMLRDMRDRSEPRSVLLAYACRTASDLLFARELKAMEAGRYPALRVIPVLTNAPPSWAGETGRLDADRLLRLSGGAAGNVFYLCCPLPMTAALVRGLRRMGVSPRRIHTDYFSL